MEELDWKTIRKIAFGPLQLTHAEFWKLTPIEFLELVDGYNSRFIRQRDLIAWHAAMIINVWSKKKISVKDLVEEKTQVNRKATTPEKTREELDNLGDQLGLPDVIIMPTKGR